jgi:TM2 domain-containing membrane protein YozV
MKISYKAALLSAFVFPGVGQFYLKRHWRGFIIMLSVFTGLGYIVWSATVATLSILDDATFMLQGGSNNLQKLSNFDESKMLTTGHFHEAVFYLIICFWLFAIIDAYIIGKEKESQDKENSGDVKIQGT